MFRRAVISLETAASEQPGDGLRSVVSSALAGSRFLRGSVIVLDGFFLPALELIIEENFNGTLSARLSGDAPPVGM